MPTSSSFAFFFFNYCCEVNRFLCHMLLLIVVIIVVMNENHWSAFLTTRENTQGGDANENVNMSKHSIIKLLSDYI